MHQHHTVLTALQIPIDLTPGASYVEYQQNQWQTIITNTSALVQKSEEADYKLREGVQKQSASNHHQLFRLQKELDPSNIKTVKTQLANIQQQLERVLQMTEQVEDLLIFLRTQQH